MLTSPASLGLSLDVTEKSLPQCVETEAHTVGILWDGALCPEGALQTFSGLGLFWLYPLQSVLVIGRIVGEKGESHLETRETCKVFHQALTGRDLYFPSSLHDHSRRGVELSLWSAEGEGSAQGCLCGLLIEP